MLKHTAVVRPSGWRSKASKERRMKASLCHWIFRPQAYQLRLIACLMRDSLHDELTKCPAFTAVYAKSHGNDKLKIIDIIADAVVLSYMAANIILVQCPLLEYRLGSLANVATEHIKHVGNLLHGHPYRGGRYGYRSAFADCYNSPVHFSIVLSFANLFLSLLAISLSMSLEIFCSVTCA